MAKRVIKGINNSRKIRVILDGVFINTTIGDVEKVFSKPAQQNVVLGALDQIGKSLESYPYQPITGFASSVGNVQVDLLD